MDADDLFDIFFFHQAPVGLLARGQVSAQRGAAAPVQPPRPQQQVQPAQHRVTLLDETLVAETAVGGFGTQPGELSSPSGVAFAPDGAFYVADTGNARVQLFSGVGNWVATFDEAVEEPRGLVVDGHGALFVADAGGAIHAFVPRTREHTVLEWPDAQPLDVAVHQDILWVLTRDPAALVRVRIVRGD